MPIAAVPRYLGQDFKDASPGLRFGMYLTLWGVNRRTQDPLWQTHDIGYEVRGQQQQEREVKYENKVAALADAKHLNAGDLRVMKALLARQMQTFDASANAHAALRLDALAIAPFTTGLGNEHPLENGFAFLNPYGLPYLPGSGVKGVLRQAARELASGEWGEAHGWSKDRAIPLMQGEGERRKPVLDKSKQPVMLSLADILFGRESVNGDADHLRGALTFWDVIPQIKGDSLLVEIMTPHQSHYYQQDRSKGAGSTTPHDSGSPNPISFLTVPPGSGFAFHIVCDTAHLSRHAPELAADEGWKTLLTRAFEHAFNWLGFGAKTAVGYGAMKRDVDAEAKAEKAKVARETEKANALRREAEEQARKAALAQMSPMERILREFLDARPDKNQSELSALLGGLKQGKFDGEHKLEIARHAEALMRAAKKWKEKSEKKNPDKDNDYQDTLKVMAWRDGR